MDRKKHVRLWDFVAAFLGLLLARSCLSQTLATQRIYGTFLVHHDAGARLLLVRKSIGPADFPPPKPVEVAA